MSKDKEKPPAESPVQAAEKNLSQAEREIIPEAAAAGPLPAPGPIVPLEELTPEGGEPPEPAGTGKKSKDQRRLMTALARAQGEVLNAVKNKANTHFSTTYADLAAIADACRVALSKNLIAWVQIPRFAEGEIWLETTLTHGPSGQYIVGDYPIPKGAQSKSQDLVAAITYARRTSLAAMVGVVSEDEDADGNDIPGDQDGMNQDQQGPKKNTKAQDKAQQWADWAAERKIPTLKTLAELEKWEGEKEKDLVDLKRLLPDAHQKVMDAIKAATDKLTPGQSDELGPHA